MSPWATLEREIDKLTGGDEVVARAVMIATRTHANTGTWAHGVAQRYLYPNIDIKSPKARNQQYTFRNTLRAIGWVMRESGQRGVSTDIWFPPTIR